MRSLLTACAAHLLEEKNLSACAKILNLPVESNPPNPDALEKTILIEILNQELPKIQEKELRIEFLSQYSEFFIKYVDKDVKNPIILECFMKFQRCLDREMVTKGSRQERPIPPIEKILKKVAPILSSLAKDWNDRCAHLSLASAYWNYPLVFISALFTEKKLYDACIELFSEASKQGLESANTALVQVYFSSRFLELNPDISESKRNELANPFLESAAKSGDGPANYWLGLIQSQNPHLSTQQRISLCLPHFQKAAEKGIQHAKEIVEAIKNHTESKKRNEEAFDNEEWGAALLSSLSQKKGGNMRGQQAGSSNSDKSKGGTKSKPMQVSVAESDKNKGGATIPKPNSFLDVAEREANISDPIQPVWEPKPEQNMTEIAKQALRYALRSFEAKFVRSEVVVHRHFLVDKARKLTRNLEVIPPENLKQPSEILEFSKAVKKLLLSKQEGLPEMECVLEKHILQKLPGGEWLFNLGRVKISSGGKPIAEVQVDLSDERIRMGSVVVVLNSATNAYFLFNRELNLVPEAPQVFSPLSSWAGETPTMPRHLVTIRVKNPAAVESKKREARDEEAPIIESEPRVEQAAIIEPAPQTQQAAIIEPNSQKKSKIEEPAPQEKSPQQTPLLKLSIFADRVYESQRTLAAECELAKLTEQQAQESTINTKETESKLQSALAKLEEKRKQKEEKICAANEKKIEAKRREREENEKLVEENLKLRKAYEEELERVQREIAALEESSGTAERETYQPRK